MLEHIVRSLYDELAFQSLLCQEVIYVRSNLFSESIIPSKYINGMRTSLHWQRGLFHCHGEWQLFFSFFLSLTFCMFTSPWNDQTAIIIVIDVFKKNPARLHIVLNHWHKWHNYANSVLDQTMEFWRLNTLIICIVFAKIIKQLSGNIIEHMKIK